METEKRLFVKCSCSGEALEFVWHKDENVLDVAMWKQGLRSHKLSWSERFRWIRQILLKGQVWTDYIILEKKDLVQVKKFLNSI